MTTEITCIDDIIREIKSKARGRTRHAEQGPFHYWDECLVAEIEEQHNEIATLREALHKLYLEAFACVAEHDRLGDICQTNINALRNRARGARDLILECGGDDDANE